MVEAPLNYDDEPEFFANLYPSERPPRYENVRSPFQNYSRIE